MVKPENFEKLIARLRASFTAEGVLEARAVEAHLVSESWLAPSWDLTPELKSLRIRTLVIYSDRDFIPVATAEHITRAMSNARMVTMKDCGHFPYMECPTEVRPAMDAFLKEKKVEE